MFYVIREYNHDGDIQYLSVDQDGGYEWIKDKYLGTAMPRGIASMLIHCYLNNEASSPFRYGVLSTQPTPEWITK